MGRLQAEGTELCPGLREKCPAWAEQRGRAGHGAEAQPQAGQAGQVESLMRFELGCGFHTIFWWRMGRDLGPPLYL